MLVEYTSKWEDASCGGPHLGPLTAPFSAPLSQGNQRGSEAGHDRASLSCLERFQPALTLVEVAQAATEAAAVVRGCNTKSLNHTGGGPPRRRRSIMSRLVPSTRSGGQLGSQCSQAVGIAAAFGW